MIAAPGKYQRRAFGSDWPEQRRRAAAFLDAAIASQDGSLGKLSQKLEHCCRAACVERSEDGSRLRLCEQRCRSRLCVRCARIRCHQLTQQMTALVKSMDSPRFVTLTIRSRNEPLEETIIRLQRAFKSLRRSGAWKKHVQGGFYAVEVTWNPKSRQWHPHLHAVVDGEYWPHQQLLAAWESAVGDHAGAHIKAVKSASSVARYVAAYVAKSSEVSNFPEDRLAEYAIAVRGLRFCQTFGTAHGLRTNELAGETVALDVAWIRAAWADDLVDAAEAGCSEAETLLQQARRGTAENIADELDDWLSAVREQMRAAQPRQVTRVIQPDKLLPWSQPP